jgi:hypothetical protein
MLMANDGNMSMTWRKWANGYSAGNIPDAAADFLASATGWGLQKQTSVDRAATRLRGEAQLVLALDVGNGMWRLSESHAIARILTVAADHLGHVQISALTKACIELYIPLA